MEWTRAAISDATRAWLARPARAPDRRRPDPGPRQPARPDLGVPDVGRRSRAASFAALLDTTPRPERPHPHPGRPSSWRDDRDRRRSGRATATASSLAGVRALLNPGSVGQPRDGDPRGELPASSTRTPDRRPGIASPYDIARGPGRDGDGRAARPARGAAGARRLRATAMIGGRRPLQGRKPGDRRVRLERPHAPYFRYTGPGQLTAKEAASAPTTRTGRCGGVGPRAASSAARSPARTNSASACQEEGAGDLQLGRDQLVGLRDRGDPAGPDPGRRGRAGLRARRSASRSASCSRSSRSAIARSASPTRPAAGRTPSRARTSAGPSRWSPPRRCSSTTS